MPEKATRDEHGMLRWRPQMEREAMSQRMRLFLEMANVISFVGGDITAVTRSLQTEVSKKGGGSLSDGTKRKETRYWKFVEMHQGEEAFVMWVRGETRDEAFLEFCRVSDKDGSPEMSSLEGLIKRSGARGSLFNGEAAKG